MFRLLNVVALLVFAVALPACSRDAKGIALKAAADSVRDDSIARARQDSINRARPDYVVDSILPVEEELRRFRKALGGDSAVALTGGSDSRDALVRRFVKALNARDTADLLRMAMRGREFTDLYYPESPYSHPPYKQSPALAWSLIQNPSTSGLNKLMQRLGGKPLTYLGHRCDPKVMHEGRSTRFAGCLVQIAGEKGDTVSKRYFGSIIERGGQFKFISYTNDF
jgi:hypothetical protein